VAIVSGYCSVADVREHIDDSGSSIPTALIERAVNAVSRAIDRYCGFPKRRFWKDSTPTAHEYVVDYPGVLYVTDIASRSGLTVQTDDAGDGTYSTTWSPTDFVLGPVNADVDSWAYAFTRIEAVGARLFPTSRIGRSTLKITGTHGWSAIPDEVTQACILRSVSILKRKDAPFGVAGFGEFGTAVRIRAEDPDVADLLSTFRRYGAGTSG
jgi:hypothetical protein